MRNPSLRPPQHFEDPGIPELSQILADNNFERVFLVGRPLVQHMPRKNEAGPGGLQPEAMNSAGSLS